MANRPSINLEKLAADVSAIAEQAGRLAAAEFRPGQRTTAEIWYKDGGSPVTAADIAADDLLRDKLHRLLPQAAWLSEETVDSADRLGRSLAWIVDPIDGTRAFLSGHSDWCVCVALLADGVPVIGSVHAPALDTHYQAIRDRGAWRNGSPIAVSAQAALGGSRVAGPRPMVAKLEKAVGPTRALERIPSLALRLARVAEGSIDIGLVSNMARDWDIAAADLVLQEAGGIMTGTDGAIIHYNNPYPVHGELAASSKLLHSSLIEALA